MMDKTGRAIRRALFVYLDIPGNNCIIYIKLVINILESVNVQLHVSGAGCPNAVPLNDR
jgi:hypothetical protein